MPHSNFELVLHRGTSRYSIRPGAEDAAGGEAVEHTPLPNDLPIVLAASSPRSSSSHKAPGGT